MSIINSVRSYLATYTGLKTGAPLWVDFLGNNPSEYAVIPLAGSKVIETYVTGKSQREFPFAFQSMESTADDLERLENQGFFETFADWLETQSEAGTLPTLGTGQTSELIEATGWGYLYEQGNSDTGVYQIQCRLVYDQD